MCLISFLSSRSNFKNPVTGQPAGQILRQAGALPILIQLPPSQFYLCHFAILLIHLAGAKNYAFLAKMAHLAL